MSISASDARKRLFPLIRQVNEDSVAIEIVSNAGNAVLVSLDEWNSIQETAYLMASPVNAARLIGAIDRHRRGDESGYVTTTIEELEAMAEAPRDEPAAARPARRSVA